NTAAGKRRHLFWDRKSESCPQRSQRTTSRRRGIPGAVRSPACAPSSDRAQKAAVTVAALIILAILFPDQLQRKVAVGLQLLPDGAEIWHDGLVPRHGWPWCAGYDFFQPTFVPVRRQRP